LADNVTLNPGTAGDTIAADDISGVKHQRVKVEFGADGSATDVSSAAPLPSTQWTALRITTASAMTRPANTTAYAALDAVANNATAGSVTPISLSVSDQNDAPTSIERIRIATTDTGVAGRAFRVWLFQATLTATAGDNAAFTVPSANMIGTMVGVFRSPTTGGSFGAFTSEDGTRIMTLPTSGGQTVFALLQTLDAFTPSANSTTFTLTAECIAGRSV